MIKCPECKEDVSESAVTCPSCGHPVAKTPADPQQEKAKTEKQRLSVAGWMVFVGVAWVLWGIWDASGHNLRAINSHTQVGLIFLLIAGIFFAVKKK